MTYEKRFDGRGFDEIRPISIKIGVLKNADGSCLFEIGNTHVIAGVFGPRNLYPRFLQNQEKAVLRCFYDMFTFSVPERRKPGPGRRETEISLVIKNALEPSLFLDDFPKSTIDVFLYITQADAGTRCAAISAASLALAEAGIPMKSLVSSVAVGKIENKITLDITKEEEDYEENGTKLATDIPIAIMPRTNEITLIQTDGRIKKEDFNNALKIGIKGCNNVYLKQKEALKKRFKL